MLRWMTAGESHGPALTAVLDGLPAGVEITAETISTQLARRRLGYGRGARMKFEKDQVRLTGGVRHGLTLGSPISVEIANTEWPRWETVMSADPVDADVLAQQARAKPLTRPRPGHADLAGMQKYDFAEARNVLERASARETAARVGAGTIAREFLRQVAGIEILSHVVSLGSVSSTRSELPMPEELAHIDDNPLRCFDEETSEQMVQEVDAAKKDADTLGGIVEILAYNVPAGLGSHVQWDRKLDGRLAQALMSIQSVKATEIGDGFEVARRRGSAAHDEIVPSAEGARRVTHRAGGLEGGITNGEILIARAAFKPISSLSRPLRTIDTETGEEAIAITQRSDVCAVPAGGVVAEAMCALTLADAVLEKFGGDSVAQTSQSVHTYEKNLRVS